MTPGVEVVTALLDVDRERVEALHALLSPDEQARAARFVLPQVRDRRVVARGTLRELLGERLGLDPRAVELIEGPFGKPALARPGPDALCFNVSHSAWLAVYAFARHRDVGVDVERLRPVRHAEHIAERFFAEAERAALRALPEAERPDAFLRGWTRKEAWLKALGSGLARPLGSFVVSLEVADARLLHVDGEPGEAARWELVPLAAPPGFVGALAVAALAGQRA